MPILNNGLHYIPVVAQGLRLFIYYGAPYYEYYECWTEQQGSLYYCSLSGIPVPGSFVGDSMVLFSQQSLGTVYLSILERKKGGGEREVGREEE